MIFSYDKKTNQISTFSETDFKSQNILERRDLEEWVKASPEILGEDFLIITGEYDKFDKTNERLDLLAVDKTGTLSIIELKRDTSGKNVELQAIKYAAYCSTLTFNDVLEIFCDYSKKEGNVCDKEKAKEIITGFIEIDDFQEFSDKPRIILVAREFTPEVTASVLWLRKFGIDISCIKLKPYQMNEDILLFESSILIPLPEAKDYMIKTEIKDNTEDMEKLQQNEEYIYFFSDLNNSIKEYIPVNLLPPKPKSYYQIPTKISRVHFEWAFHGTRQKIFGVELHFEKKNKEENIKIFNQLLPYKNELEKALNEKVIFQPDWRQTESKIYIEKSGCQMNNDLKKWATDNMLIFYNILNPVLEKIDI